MGGTKKKVGKQRRDKAYWSAKEIGYRSRASFKLVQLNRKFEFLQKSRVCLDLCAAPGSWMQVAKEHMPVSSLIIGVDLVSIKPIPGCIVLQNDITTDKCRSDLRKELQTWKADLVLHDGAGNVGKSWIHDAYQQSLLTLSAFRMATEFLVKGGTFVTKVFRSKDYQSLIWVFNQFFRKVHSTKPAASRNESAEIFVVCQGYKAPDKIDPKFLDARHVFSEVEGDEEAAEARDRELLNPERRKKAPAEGYETGATLLYKKAKASEFILEDKPIHVLNNFNEIVLDEPRIYKNAKTTKEVVECCKDLKVLGMKELRLLKKWREALRAEFEATAKAELEKKKKAEENGQEGKGEEKSDDEEEEDEELQELNTHIEKLKDEERRLAKRTKKRSLKEKRKIAEKIDLKMIIPGDEGPTLVEEGLFRIKDLKSVKDLDRITEGEPEDVAESDEEDSDGEGARKKRKMEKYSKESRKIDKSGLYYKESDSEGEDEDEEESEEEMGALGFDHDDDIGEFQEEGNNDDDEEEDSNPLLLDLDESSKETKKKRKADLWFDRDVFKGIEEEDEALTEADIEGTIKSIKKTGGKVASKKRKNEKVEEESSSDDEDDEDDEQEEEEDDDSGSDFDVERESYRDKKKAGKKKEKEGFEVVPQGKTVKKKKGGKNVTLNPEELALGQEMIMSKKRKRDVIDSGWNRFMFNERDEDLPDWFVKEEEMHMRRRAPPMDAEVVEHYKKQQRELNVKTIKKVVEAKARKKRRMVKRMDKAKKKAAVLLDNPDLGSREKANEIQRLYRKAANSQKREVTYVVAKKTGAGRRAVRPAGVKGAYKQVDPRMKKDTIKKRGNATQKRTQKRRWKGKQAKPSRN